MRVLKMSELGTREYAGAPHSDKTRFSARKILRNFLVNPSWSGFGSESYNNLFDYKHLDKLLINADRGGRLCIQISNLYNLCIAGGREGRVEMFPFLPVNHDLLPPLLDALNRHPDQC